MVSFSINEQGGSFAVFGGVDSSQVVGGQAGMQFAQNIASKSDTWALEGQSFSYGTYKIAEDVKYNAIIDTGCSQVALPHGIYWTLQDHWAKAVPSIDCSTHDVFCFTLDPCSKIENQL